MIRLLRSDPPPRIEEIRQAHDVACRTADPHAALVKVGLCDEQGELLAIVELRDGPELIVFLSALTPLGYGESIVLGREEEMHGCDFVFRCGHEETGLIRDKDLSS